MICARCDEPIREGDEFETRDIMSPTTFGATVYLHKPLCKRPPTQTAPVPSGFGRIRGS